jgi:hypothetical protein
MVVWSALQIELIRWSGIRVEAHKYGQPAKAADDGLGSRSGLPLILEIIDTDLFRLEHTQIDQDRIKQLG